jgi:hypothetical protein
MAETCKSPEQLRQELEAAKVAAMEAEIDRLRSEQQKIAENDTTVISIAPISIPNDQSTVELTGLYFNKPEIRLEDEPAQELVIEKDTLDRSSGMIIGRFEYKADARAKIVAKVFLDGKMIQEFGTNLPYESTTGIYDCVLLKYPNSARANIPGRHKVHIEYGMVVGIAESQLGLLNWGTIKGATTADFLIRLLPHKQA